MISPVFSDSDIMGRDSSH